MRALLAAALLIATSAAAVAVATPATAQPICSPVLALHDGVEEAVSCLQGDLAPCHFAYPHPCY